MNLDHSSKGSPWRASHARGRGTLLGLAGGGSEPVEQTAPQGPLPKPPANDPQAQFVSKVLRSTEQVWTDVFRESGRTYQVPKLVLYRGSWPTGCGRRYCPKSSARITWWGQMAF